MAAWHKQTGVKTIKPCAHHQQPIHICPNTRPLHKQSTPCATVHTPPTKPTHCQLFKKLEPKHLADADHQHGAKRSNCIA